MVSNNISFRGWQPDDWTSATGKMPHDTFVGNDRAYYEDLIKDYNSRMGKNMSSASSKEVIGDFKSKVSDVIGSVKKPNIAKLPPMANNIQRYGGLRI